MSFKKLIYERTRTVIVKGEDVKKFAKIVGDFNPIHLNEQFAKKTRFKKIISHGMLGVGYIQSLIPANLRIKQLEIKFKRPIFLDDEIKIQVKIFQDNSLVSLINNNQDKNITQVSAKLYIEEQL